MKTSCLFWLLLLVVYFLLQILTTTTVNAKICYISVERTRRKCSGWWLLEKCWNEKYTEQHEVCCEGWKTLATRCNTPICGNNCNYVGECYLPNTCSCPETHYPPFCTLCLQIDNCKRTTCTDYFNNRCQQCNSDFGSLGKAFQLTNENKVCSQRCSWQENSNLCYPGTCPSTLNTCTCAQHFGGYDCSQITTPPSIGYGLTIFLMPTDKIDVEFSEGKKIYINSKLNPGQTVSVSVNVESIFQPQLPDPRQDTDDKNAFPNGRGHYITSHQVGVTSLKSSYFHYGTNVFYELANLISEDSNNPIGKRSLSDNSRLLYFSHSPQHSHRIQWTLMSMNGGSVDFQDLDTSTSKRKGFHGKFLQETMEIVFDYEPPFHYCFHSQSCNRSPTMLQLVTGEIVSQTNKIGICWSEWTDDMAGIGQFILEVNSLTVKKDNVLGQNHGSSRISFESKHEPQAGRMCQEFSLPMGSVHMYEVVLTASDAVKNSIKNWVQARRLFLFDMNGSEISVWKNRPLTVSQPGFNGAMIVMSQNRWWATGRQVNNVVPLQFDWTGHFSNEIHSKNHLLGQVEAVNSIPAEYDDNEGERTIRSIPNSLGITKFYQTYTIDGSSINQWEHNYQHIDWQSQTFNMNIEDGSRLTFYVKAEDFVKRSAIDQMEVFIDSSPPIIAEVGLRSPYSNENLIFVHDKVDLINLRMSWQAYDLHSGLYEISWRLFENSTTSGGTDHVLAADHLGNQQFPDQQSCTKSRSTTNCYCTKHINCYDLIFDLPKGTVKNNMDHDDDFYFQIEVTNQALLKSVSTVKITIDTTPPHTGSVHHGYPEQTQEKRFQSTRQLQAFWNGFVDMESGIDMYAIVWHTQCLTQTQILAASDKIITKTQQSTWQAPSTGTFFLSVVAFNQAHLPSESVCSRGITIDESPPLVSNVKVENVIVHPHPQVLCDSNNNNNNNNNNNVFLLLHNGFKQLVHEPSQECQSKCNIGTASNNNNIELFPLLTKTQYQNKTKSIVIVTATSKECEQVTTKHNKGNNLYVNRRDKIVVKWNSTDKESGITGHLVNILHLDENNQVIPEEEASMKDTTVLETWTWSYPPIHHGDRILIQITAENNAGLKTLVNFGPIRVITRPPKYPVEAEYDFVDKDLLITWPTEFPPNVVQEEGLVLQFAIGSQERKSDIVAYSDVPSTPRCRSPIQNNCADLSLNLLLNTSTILTSKYHVTLRLTNAVSTSAIIATLCIEYNRRAPSEGVVWHLQPTDKTDDQSTSLEDHWTQHDADKYQLKSNSLRIAWRGFVGSESLFVCIGQENDCDFLDYMQIQHKTTEESASVRQIQFNNLTLNVAKSYHSCIKAINRHGETKACSQKMFIVSDDLTLPRGSAVFDGKGDELEMRFDSNGIFYQASMDTVNLHWTLPDHLTKFVTLQRLRVEQFINGAWTQVMDLNPQRIQTHSLTVTCPRLASGSSYRTVVEFCHESLCFLPMKTKGFVILDRASVSGQMWVAPMNKRPEDSNKMIIQFDLFYQPQFTYPLDKIDDVNSLAVDHYELQLQQRQSEGYVVLQIWKNLVDCSPLSRGNINQLSCRIILSTPLQDKEKCYRWVLSAVNRALFHSFNSLDYGSCSSSLQTKFPVKHVKDISDGITQEIEYTNSLNEVNVTWSTVNHQKFHWALVRTQLSDNEWRNISTLDELRQQQDVLMEGDTVKKSLSVKIQPKLVSGNRYRVCIHANQTIKKHEKFNEVLPELFSCSRGVLVDHSLPEKGRVFLPATTNSFQQSTSEIVISWDGFHGMTVRSNNHDKGIEHYEYSIGSELEQRDVVDFTVVEGNLNNTVIVSGLNLRAGKTYYVVVRGVNYLKQYVDSDSHSVTIIDKGPTAYPEELELSHTNINDPNGFQFCWFHAFVELHCPISHYLVGVGDAPHRDNILSVQQLPTTASPCLAFSSEQLSSLRQGSSVYITLRAVNLAGLFTSIVSPALLVDFTPPLAGHVLDMDPEQSNETYSQFQHNSQTLCAMWNGFHDPHTPITSCQLQFGSCPTCGDVWPWSDVGTASLEYCVDGLSLSHAQTYYAKLRCCNQVGLCSETLSPGILVDLTPPSSGKIILGGHESTHFNHYVHYSRDSIALRWLGFKDPESGIHESEWWIGSQPGSLDILEPQPTYGQTRLHFTAAHVNQTKGEVHLLPQHEPFFVSMRVVNGVGQESIAISSAIIVDTSPPEIVHALTINNTQTLLEYAHVNSDKQKDKEIVIVSDILSFFWTSTDKESGVVAQTLSLQNLASGEVVLSDVTIPANVGSWVWSQLALHDGDEYGINLHVCNGVGLCTDSNTKFLVDSSPPTTGHILVQSQRTSQHVDESYWNASHICVSWAGFADPHSDIAFYFMSTSRTFQSLNKIKNNSRIPHNSSGGNNSSQQHCIGLTEMNVSVGDTVYVNIQAYNKAFLASDRLEFGLILFNDGKLLLHRQCRSETCYGHCACGTVHQYCQPQWPCSVIRTDNLPQAELKAQLLWMGSLERGGEFVSSSKRISVSQMVISNSFMDKILRMECTLDHLDIDVTQRGRKWLSPTFNNLCIYSFTQQGELEPYVPYRFYWRVWTSAEEYHLVTSPPFSVHPQPFAVHKKQSQVVREVQDPKSTRELDFIRNTQEFYISWKNVFTGLVWSNASLVDKLIVSVATWRAGGQTLLSANVPSDSTFYRVSAEQVQQLQNGIRYYSCVLACSITGMCAEDCSDGFLVDSHPPRTGVVLDGNEMNDVDYLNDGDNVTARWHGFVDWESSLHHYEWCLEVEGGNNSTECDVVPWRNVGLENSINIKLSSFSENWNGQKLINKVRACDRTGLCSSVVKSDGVIVDMTSPSFLVHEEANENMLLNPSFELDEDGCSNQTHIVLHACQPKYWSRDLTNDNKQRLCSVVEDKSRTFSHTGERYLLLKRGSISQSFITEIGSLYRISVYAAVWPGKELDQNSLSDEKNQIKQSYLTLTIGKHQTTSTHFIKSTKNNIAVPTYQKVVRYFRSDAGEILLTLSVLQGDSIIIDDAHLDKVNAEMSNDENENAAGVQVEINTINNVSSLHVTWSAEDPESDIESFMWSAGYVRGGIQLVSFKPLGRQSFAVLENVYLPHKADVHVTVIAKNKAGLSTKVHASPIKVDLTSPVFTKMWDGDDPEEDREYERANSRLFIQFEVVDFESNVNYCDWCFGSQAGSCDISPMKRTPQNTFLVHYDATEIILHPRIFGTVRCCNTQGLCEMQSTNGVHIYRSNANKDPTGNLRVIETQMKSNDWAAETKDRCFSSLSSLALSWSGFSDNLQTSHYQISLGNNNQLFIQNKSMGFNAENSLVLHFNKFQQNATPNSLTVNVSRFNEAGDVHSHWSGSFTDGTKLILTEENPIVILNKNSNEKFIDWTNVFRVEKRCVQQEQSVLYEICAGTEAGIIDRVHCVDNKFKTNFTLAVADGQEKIHFVIRAFLQLTGENLVANFLV